MPLSRERWARAAVLLLRGHRPQDGIVLRILEPCPNDTDGDGDCGRPYCMHCRGRAAEPAYVISGITVQWMIGDEYPLVEDVPLETQLPQTCGNPECYLCRELPR